MIRPVVLAAVMIRQALCGEYDPGTVFTAPSSPTFYFSRIERFSSFDDVTAFFGWRDVRAPLKPFWICAAFVRSRLVVSRNLLACLFAPADQI